MKRREFLAASAGTLALLTTGQSRAAQAGGKQFIELRIYHFESADKQKQFDQFLAQAGIPALNRAGVKPVGVFRLLKADNPKADLKADSTHLYVLLPHDSIESFMMLHDRLGADAELRKATQDDPDLEPKDVHFESSLMLGFDQCPRVEVPSRAPTRLLQLRIYESRNAERARMKIHMFNEGGELAIFRRCGMNPVFFGQTLAGSRMHNLTYMLSFDDEKAQAKAWADFGKDPDWVKLRDDPKYRDTVSNITNLILRPAMSSQI